MVTSITYNTQNHERKTLRLAVCTNFSPSSITLSAAPTVPFSAENTRAHLLVGVQPAVGERDSGRWVHSDVKRARGEWRDARRRGMESEGKEMKGGWREKARRGAVDAGAGSGVGGDAGTTAEADSRRQSLQSSSPTATPLFFLRLSRPHTATASRPLSSVVPSPSFACSVVVSTDTASTEEVGEEEKES